MSSGFDPAQAARDPMTQFDAWFAQTQQADLFAARAMTLATLNAGGRPSARTVLLVDHNASGFAFCTDDRSPKAADLARLPWAALVFHWPELERQIRIEGEVERLPDAEADAYFANRAWAAQIAAWAGTQSAVIAGRAGLEQALLEQIAAHGAGSVPRPPHYGAYLLRPAMVEFWQGRTDRLHDRVRYLQQPDQTWRLDRLAP